MAGFKGVADAGTHRPANGDALWPAASLSKPVFAYAALRLVDEGKLDLDKPLKSYVPDHAPADARGDKITARHVLSHQLRPSQLAQSYRSTARSRLRAGSKFQYSGEGYYYLLRAVEHITGLGFEQFMEERLFGPLGMKSSTYAWRTDVPARIVTGHDQGQPRQNFMQDFSTRLLSYAEQQGKPLASFTSEDVAAAMAKMSPVPAILPNYMIPNCAGSLLTTPAEYAAFLSQLVNGQNRAVALKPETRELMFTSVTPINGALSWGLGLGQENHARREIRLALGRQRQLEELRPRASVDAFCCRDLHECVARLERRATSGDRGHRRGARGVSVALVNCTITRRYGALAPTTDTSSAHPAA